MPAVEAITNIAALKILNPLGTGPSFPILTPVVFVQGYTYPGDGGGGTFIFRKHATNNPLSDDGIFIDSSLPTVKTNGIWIRCFSGYIDMRFYGLIDDHPNPTLIIQNAIDYAERCAQGLGRPFGHVNSNTVFIPNGTFYISTLTIKNGVRLIGASTHNTVLVAIFDSNPYLIQTAPGLNRDIQIENLTMYGTSKDAQLTWNATSKLNNNKGCLGFIDQKYNGGGGVWDSVFRNLKIEQFTGDSIRFVGATGEADFSMTNQFNTFENVQVQSAGQLKKKWPDFNNAAHALILLGANGQLSFTNCRFDGGDYLYNEQGLPDYSLSGISVYIGSAVFDPPLPIDRRLNIPHPAVINFNTCTIQSAAVLVTIESCNNIKFDGCWFENSERAFEVKGRFSTSKAINILNNSFLYCAGKYGVNPPYEPNTGVVILSHNSQVNANNNYVVDTQQNELARFMAVDTELVGSVQVPAKNLGLNGTGNYFEPIGIGLSYLGYTRGIKTNVTDFTGGIIRIDSSKSIYLLNSTSQTVSTILSQSIAGEYLFIRAAQGTVTFVDTAAGNLYLGVKNPLVLQNGNTALFIKIDEKKTSSNYLDTYNLVTVLQ